MIDSKQIDEIEVLSTSGESTRLERLWQDQTVVLALVRHFG